MTEHWRRVDLPNGTSVPVRRNSPADAAFSHDVTALGSGVPMSWSLGTLGDLMWMRLPETRPFLAERIARAVQDAIDQDDELILLVGPVAADALWHPVMRPALDSYPNTKDRVAAQFLVVGEAYLADHPDWDARRGALENYVFSNLQEPEYRHIVEEVDPALASLIEAVGG
ncbi:hypothetical protein [Actinophytocola glycyrrhizae]|uniref:Uncharacterized protein n=1 Tax=Actinophytocola glycyrrhizae TaxID=2044873 RepID=A0ABV9S5D9_9PSEU